MTIAEEISSVWGQISQLYSALRNSRHPAERKELQRNINSLNTRLKGLRHQLKQESDPCQTQGCENEVDEHPTACTMCADREAEHG